MEEARPLLQLFDEELPAELKGKSAEAQAAAWARVGSRRKTPRCARVCGAAMKDTLVQLPSLRRSLHQTAASDGAGTLGRA